MTLPQNLPEDDVDVAEADGDESDADTTNEPTPTTPITDDVNDTMNEAADTAENSEHIPVEKDLWRLLR